jgi:hypothetical protein
MSDALIEGPETIVLILIKNNEPAGLKLFIVRIRALLLIDVRVNKDGLPPISIDTVGEE